MEAGVDHVVQGQACNRALGDIEGVEDEFESPDGSELDDQDVARVHDLAADDADGEEEDA